MFPFTPTKYTGKRIASAKDILSHFGLEEQIKTIRKLHINTAILTFNNSLIKSLIEALSPETIKIGAGHTLVFPQHKLIIRGGFGIGAPITAIVVEELIYMGIENFFIIGAAGAIDPSLSIGDIALCTAALRDEGTSYHYYPPEPRIMPAPQTGIDMLKKVLRQTPYREVVSWTTDAPYMETAEEITRYQKMGISTVEMEASLLFTLSKVFQITTGAVFAISDKLDPETGHHIAFADIHTKLLEIIHLLLKNHIG